MPDPKPRRLHDLDALRSFAMLLGIALHAALSFMPMPWVVQDQSQSPVYAVFVSAVHGFRMPLFFLLSGFFTAMLWQRRGLGGLVKQRTKRIFVPLLLGLVTIIPLMWVVVIWAGAGSTTYSPDAKNRDIWSASAHGDVEAVERYIEMGADVDQIEPFAGQTPLGWATLTGQPAVVSTLLDAGADPNVRLRDDNTALHSASFFGRAECARLLVDADADVMARNLHGESPIDSARHDRELTEYIAGLLEILIDFDDVKLGRIEIRALLREHGALAGVQPADVPKRDEDKAATELVGLLVALMVFPFFHHLWFLWFLIWMVAGFVLAVGIIRVLRIPALPSWLLRTPIAWLWIVPLTMWPQMQMHLGGALPGFGPDTSAGLLPMPHVLLYYGVFFAVGALYYVARDDRRKVGRFWWLLLPFAVGVVFPVGGGLATRQPWALDLVDTEDTRRVVAALSQVLYAWLMVFGLIGLFRRVLSSERPWVRYLSDASYWFYLVHLPLVIAGQAIVRDWPLPAFAKFVLVLVVVSAILLATYRYWVRYTWIGRMLNGPRVRPTDQRGKPQSTQAAQ